MSKSANPGELRTVTYFMRVERTTNQNGVPVPREVNVFGQDSQKNERYVLTKWVNAHGNEVIAAMQLELKELATITMRYSPLVTRSCLVYCGTDPVAFEIVSIDDVENRHRWLEIKVARKMPAR